MSGILLRLLGKKMVFHKIWGKIAMKQQQCIEQLCGLVEQDESYFGGRQKDQQYIMNQFQPGCMQLRITAMMPPIRSTQNHMGNKFRQKIQFNELYNKIIKFCKIQFY